MTGITDRMLLWAAVVLAALSCAAAATFSRPPDARVQQWYIEQLGRKEAENILLRSLVARLQEQRQTPARGGR